jgi:DNA-binding NtrC family response regulator
VVVIVLSGHLAGVVAQKAIDSGAVGYIEKGIAADALVAQLRRFVADVR